MNLVKMDIYNENEINNVVPIVYMFIFLNSSFIKEITEEELLDYISKSTQFVEITYEDFKKIVLDELDNRYTIYLFKDNDEIKCFSLLCRIDNTTYFLSDSDLRLNDEENKIYSKFIINEFKNITLDDIKKKRI